MRDRKRNAIMAQLTGSLRYQALVRHEARQAEHWNLAPVAPPPKRTWQANIAMGSHLLLAALGRFYAERRV